MVVSKFISNSLSNLSVTISKCNNPKNPHLKPKPSAEEDSASKEKLESLTKKPIIGNRVHFLNYNYELPLKLKELGFVYDASLRYSKDKIDEKEMGYSKIDGLIEFPVTLMDAYLFTHIWE